jgi:hypothetical protein
MAPFPHFLFPKGLTLLVTSEPVPDLIDFLSFPPLGIIKIKIFYFMHFIDLGVHIRCPSLELESHDCIHELVEGISQGPPTRTLLRLQSLGTDYGSDEFGTCTSSEENGQAKEEEIQIPIVEYL